MEHFRYALRLNLPETIISPAMAARVALLEKYEPAIFGMVIRHSAAKNIDRTRHKNDVLVGRIALQFFSMLEQGLCSAADFEEWAMTAGPTHESFEVLPPALAFIDDCGVVELDSAIVHDIYSAVARGAGHERRARFDATGGLIWDKDLFFSPQTMLKQLYAICTWRAQIPYIRWPDIDQCEAAGRALSPDAPVRLLPAAVAQALLPLLRVT